MFYITKTYSREPFLGPKAYSQTFASDSAVKTVFMLLWRVRE